MVATRRSTAAEAAAAAEGAAAGPASPTTPRKTKAAQSPPSSNGGTAAPLLALVAGALGALAASFGKLSGQACPSLFPPESTKALFSSAPHYLAPAWLTPQLACRSLLLSLLLAANLSATGLLLRALSQKLPSLQATVLSNASNLACTGALGALLFGEPVTARWAAGVATVGAGLWLISRAAAGSSPEGAARRPRGAPPPAKTPTARQPRQRRSA